PLAKDRLFFVRRPFADGLRRHRALLDALQQERLIRLARYDVRLFAILAFCRKRLIFEHVKIAAFGTIAVMAAIAMLLHDRSGLEGEIALVLGLPAHGGKPQKTDGQGETSSCTVHVRVTPDSVFASSFPILGEQPTVTSPDRHPGSMAAKTQSGM